MLWDEENGWSVAIETRYGDDLIVLAYLGTDLLPAPAAVHAFVRALLAGQLTPPRFRHPGVRADLTTRLYAHHTPVQPRPSRIAPASTAPASDADVFECRRPGTAP